MKLAMVVIGIAILSAGAQGKSREPGRDKRQVTVYFEDRAEMPYELRTQAQGLASEMFASIGVKLQWRQGSLPASESAAIAMEFVRDTPETRLPGAMGYALPYEGAHIGIFWDRIKADPSPRVLLAHVMVHEITHILEGVARHSDEGVMKAQWTLRDQSAMQSKPLRFSPIDVQLIHAGVDARAAGAPRRAGQTMTTAAVELAAR